MGTSKKKEEWKNWKKILNDASSERDYPVTRKKGGQEGGNLEE